MSNSEFDISRDLYYDEVINTITIQSSQREQTPLENYENSGEDWTEREFQAFTKALKASVMNTHKFRKIERRILIQNITKGYIKPFFPFLSNSN